MDYVNRSKQEKTSSCTSQLLNSFDVQYLNQKLGRYTGYLYNDVLVWTTMGSFRKMLGNVWASLTYPHPSSRGLPLIPAVHSLLKVDTIFEPPHSKKEKSPWTFWLSLENWINMLVSVCEMAPYPLYRAQLSTRPIELWSKVVHYVGDRASLGMHGMYAFFKIVL